MEAHPLLRKKPKVPTYSDLVGTWPFDSIDVSALFRKNLKSIGKVI